MRLGTILILVIIALAIWLVFRSVKRENFFPNTSLTINWAPNTVAPQDMAYNWGVCISSGYTPSGRGQCLTQTPNYPPGNPTSLWNYKGQTPKGVPSLTLNNTNCGFCNTGQVLVLQLQAVNLSNPSIPKSEWVAFTIDLTAKSKVVKNSISDASNPNLALYPGSTGFTYVLQLDQPGFESPNKSIASVSLVRGGSSFTYSNPAPFTSISPDHTTGVYTASFLNGALWSPSAPGALQVGDVMTVYASVTYPGIYGQSGEVFFSGSASQTVVTATPSAPTGVIWSIE